MEFSGLALWADHALERPRWVRGTWRVDGGVIRRISDDETATSVGFIVPGMVDTHCHIGYSDVGSVSERDMVEQARVTLASGVTVVRDCGVPVDNSAAARATGLHLIRCGRHVARPKRYMRDLPLDVQDQRELPDVLATMARSADGWVKIVGDWIDRSAGADSDLMPLWDTAVLTDAVAAVHDAGARIAVHAFSHRVIDSLIEAGVDDIEHGSGIDADQASEIAARGIAVTPTLRQVELFRDFAAQAGEKYPVYAATMQRMYDTRWDHFQMLVDSGVLLLMGTDSGGYQDHGTIAGELELWLRWGAPAQATIDAATWVSQHYLGYPGLVEGGPADFLILDEDPRSNPLELSRPARVILDGDSVWERPSA
ncbi:amidohydrolase family protein [Schaalia odontolytica]